MLLIICYLNGTILKKSSKTKKYYLCGVPPSPFGRLLRMKGEMAERSNAAVLKTVVRLPANRGFESLFLRRPNHSRSLLRDFCFTSSRTWLARVREDGKQKDHVNKVNMGVIWDAGISRMGSPQVIPHHACALPSNRVFLHFLHCLPGYTITVHLFSCFMHNPDDFITFLLI
jgi:hypothetical protein